MKFFEYLKHRAEAIGSWVCVGLDIDPEKMPPHLRPRQDGVLAFGQEIVHATADLALCYKINAAFFEAQGLMGYHALELLVEGIPEDVPVIYDAKRGDIGNTSEQYARACFDLLGADAITVNPYLGRDAIEPFLEYEQRGVFVLGATSNPGAKDFQNLYCDGKPLYEHVARQVSQWNERGNCGLVVGATRGEVLSQLRQIAPDLPFLVPGVGAQGGDLEEVARWGRTDSGVPPIINSSRGILYASTGKDFAEAARAAAEQMRDAIRYVAGS